MQMLYSFVCVCASFLHLCWISSHLTVIVCATVDIHVDIYVTNYPHSEELSILHTTIRVSTPCLCPCQCRLLDKEVD